MAATDRKQDIMNGGVVLSVQEIDETSPLLDSHTKKAAYVTFPEQAEETWQPSPGFWWIETGACDRRKGGSANLGPC